MSRAELRRVGVMTRVEAGELKLVDAAQLMGLSYRQAIRVKARYETEGPEGLKHRNAGKPSSRAKPQKFREQVLRLVRKKYGGEDGEQWGPTLAAEHLESDEGLKIDHETLRRWMLQEGLWSRRRQRKQHRSRRERKEHFGELVQLDGSFHEWLPGSGQRQCLMNLVDDATSRTLSQLHEQETTWAAADVLRAWIEKYGIPQALYTDWKNVYLREPTAQERLAGEEAFTQFGRMCRKLGTKIVGASSPQAKGRVERSHGTLQDRLIKKLRLYRVRTMREANRFLRRYYLADHNRRFSRAPGAAEDYHRPTPRPTELDAIFRMEQERVISNDWVVQYQGRFLQIERESCYAPAASKVIVSEGRRGDLQIWYRDRPVKWRDISRPAPRPERCPRAQGHARELRKKVYRPAATHPWRKWKPSWLQRQAARATALPVPRSSPDD